VWSLVSGTYRGTTTGTSNTTLTIVGNNITGFRDCNTSIGSVFRDGVAFIAGELQTTLIACGETTPSNYLRWQLAATRRGAADLELHRGRAVVVLRNTHIEDHGHGIARWNVAVDCEQTIAVGNVADQ